MVSDGEIDDDLQIKLLQSVGLTRFKRKMRRNSKEIDNSFATETEKIVNGVDSWPDVFGQGLFSKMKDEMDQSNPAASILHKLGLK